MMDTLENLRSKIERVDELSSVVRSMKALSASNIQQYEKAEDSLMEFEKVVKKGLHICRLAGNTFVTKSSTKESRHGAVIFGSGQGLVGRFDNLIAHYSKGELDKLAGQKMIWTVGHSVESELQDLGLELSGNFEVPNSMSSITPLISALVQEVYRAVEEENLDKVSLFFNQRKGTTYAPVKMCFFPIDDEYWSEVLDVQWTSNQVPEVVFNVQSTFQFLLREYYFVTLFRACIESLASENASRLATMQSAEKNIGEMLTALNLDFHKLRQERIDEELFDIISGSDAFEKP